MGTVEFLYGVDWPGQPGKSFYTFTACTAEKSANSMWECFWDPARDKVPAGGVTLIYVVYDQAGRMYVPADGNAAIMVRRVVYSPLQ
ncbi:MAG: hypothetical protein HYW33_01945 [Candidatus Blackburnbacteria bacterium]|nr:hypothetical protein [Candidatus Blackburnbacteria bacterium]